MIRSDEYVPYEQLITTSADSVLSKTKRSLNKDVWEHRMAESLRLAALHKEVERIFIHPVIKKEMCRHFAGEEWMNKLRPWWGHHRHFHVRLSCPADSPSCIKQDAPPAGDGCGAQNLANWIRDVTAPPKKKTTAAKSTKPKKKKKTRRLVAACDTLAR